jgi:hypothetical protein
LEEVSAKPGGAKSSVEEVNALEVLIRRSNLLTKSSSEEESALEEGVECTTTPAV